MAETADAYGAIVLLVCFWWRVCEIRLFLERRFVIFCVIAFLFLKITRFLFVKVILLFELNVKVIELRLHSNVWMEKLSLESFPNLNQT